MDRGQGPINSGNNKSKTKAEKEECEHKATVAFIVLLWLSAG